VNSASSFLDQAHERFIQVLGIGAEQLRAARPREMKAEQ
jgi:hypothetical protein